MIIEQKVNAIMRYIVAESENEKQMAIEEIKAISNIVDKSKGRCENLDYVISDILTELGMPSHVMGYRYAVYAIKSAVENPNIINAIIGELYFSVANHYETTESRVERAIRHGIECAWGRADIDVVEKYFGNTISPIKGKPTNSEFIARIADVVRRRFGNG